MESLLRDSKLGATAPLFLTPFKHTYLSLNLKAKLWSLWSWTDAKPSFWFISAEPKKVLSPRSEFEIKSNFLSDLEMGVLK